MQIENLHSTTLSERRSGQNSAVLSSFRRKKRTRQEQAAAAAKQAVVAEVKESEARTKEQVAIHQHNKEKSRKSWLQLQDTNHAAMRLKVALPKIIQQYGRAVQMAYAGYNLASHADMPPYQCTFCRWRPNQNDQGDFSYYLCYTHGACKDCQEMLNQLFNTKLFMAEACQRCDKGVVQNLLEYLHTHQTSNLQVSPETIAVVAQQLGLGKVVMMKEFSISSGGGLKEDSGE